MQLEEQVLVQRVVWPVLVDVHPHRGKPGDCENLDAARIVVEEDGTPALVERIDREPRPTVHAILLDASPSMEFLGRLAEAREAAKRYVRSLRPDDRVMVLSFSSDLILHVPVTLLARDGAHSKVEKAIEGIEARSGTALRDALFQVVRHLAAYPERKVVVALSDGWDTTSRQSASTVRGLTATTPDLTIFPVAAELGEDWRSLLRGQATRGIPSALPRGPDEDPRPFLEDLVENSGGEYFEFASPGMLGEIFQRVRDRLNRELNLTYVPLPFGEGPRDPDGKLHTFRKVRVRSLDPRCVVKTLKRERFVAAQLRPPAAEGGPGKANRDEKGVLPLPSRVAIPPPAGWADVGAGESFLILEQVRVLGQTTDLVQEWFGGPKKWWYKPRAFHLPLPPLEQTLRRPVTDPEEVLLYWLLNEIAVELPEDPEQEERMRPVVNGQTMLELAPSLARAIFDHYADYRAWTLARLRRDVEDQIRQTFPKEPDDWIQGLVASRMAKPPLQSPQPYLAAWLADVHATDLVRRLERRVISELLRTTPESLPVVEAVADRVERGWPSFRFWFRVAERVGIVAPLFLFHDPQRDVIGFIRVVLPEKLTWNGQPSSRTVPEHPRALRLVRWMLRFPEAFEELRGRWQIEDFFYRNVSDVELKEVDRAWRDEKGMKQVEISLLWRPSAPDESPTPSEMKVYIAESSESWELICWSAGAQSPFASMLGYTNLKRCTGARN